MHADSSRLTVRLSKSEKREIHRAARLLGVSTSSFVRAAARDRAHRVILAHMHTETVALAPDESARLLDLIDAPFAPGPKLAHALRRVRAL